MTAPAPAVSAPAAPLVIHNPLSRDTVTFLRRADEHGATELRLEVAPGGGLERHAHDAFAETFTCLSGVLGVQVGREVLRLCPGESATAPIGAAHRWFNDGGEVAVARVTVGPAHAGMERALIVLYGLARDGLRPESGGWTGVLRLAWLADLSNSRVTGPLRALNPLLRTLARAARRRGLDRELLARYGA